MAGRIHANSARRVDKLKKYGIIQIMFKKILRSYLKFWAQRYLERVKPKIVAITGSVGKTSAKEAIFEVLKTKYAKNVRKSEGNLNNETGLPLAILNYKKAPSYGKSKFGWISILFSVPFRSYVLEPVEILVLEMGADKPGDIEYLTKIAKPDIAVLTAIAPAHLEAFETLENIMQEKTGLLRALDKNGWAVLNIDNELVRKSSHGGWWQKKNYAIHESADVKASEICSSIKNYRGRTTFKVQVDNQSLSISQATLGNVFVLASLASISVGKIMNVSNDQITEGLANLKLAHHRMNVFEGKNKTVVLDDCYNANPISMRAALDVLKNLPKSGRKIVVLGEMREIGKTAVQAHKEIGRYASEVADLTISVGKQAKKYNFSKNFTDVSQAGEYLLNETKENDIILIKASRGAGESPMLEPLVDLLKK